MSTMLIRFSVSESGVTEVLWVQFIHGTNSGMEKLILILVKIARTSRIESLPQESLVPTEHTILVFITQSFAPPLILHLEKKSALTLLGGLRPLPIIRRGLMTHIFVRSPVTSLALIVMHALVKSSSTAPGQTPASTQTWSVTATPSARTTRTRTMSCAGRNTLTRRSLNSLQALSANQ